MADDAAEQRRKRRQQRIMGDGKSRLERIQSTLYKSMPSDVSPSSTPVENAEEQSPQQRVTPEKPQRQSDKQQLVEKESSEESISQEKSSSQDSMFSTDKSQTGGPSLTQSTSQLLSSTFNTREEDASSSAAVPTTTIPTQPSFTTINADLKNSQKSVFDIVFSLISGIIAFIWVVYAAATTAEDGYKGALINLKRCLQNGCMEYEWDQNGISLAGVYAISQISLIAYQMLVNGRQLNALDGLKILVGGFPVFFLGFSGCCLIAIHLLP